MRTTFYRCNICGNVIIKTSDSGVQVECCSEYMEELVPKTNNEGLEKHVPFVTKIDDNTWKVEIGSTHHPMLKEHHIEFIYLESSNGGQIVYLKPGQEPVAIFYTKEKPTAFYEYCNVHGLWGVDIV